MRISPVIVSVVASCAVALAAAACGGSSSSSSGASTVAAGGGSTSMLDTGGSSTGSSGGSGFCGDATGRLRSFEQQMAKLALIASEPERLKKQMQTLQTFAAGAEADAPGEIKPDIAVFADYLKHLADAFAKANYNPAVAAATIGPYIQQQQSKLEAASQHVRAWATANCGL
jgi:hypothetical protein